MRGIDLFGLDTPMPGGSHRAAFLWWVIWVAWLPLFIPVAVGFVQAHPPAVRLALSFAGAAVFFALYLRTNWRSANHYANQAPRPRPRGAVLWAPIAVMITLSVVLTLWNGDAWGALCIYTAACAGGWLPARPAVIVIAALAAFAFVGVGARSGLGAALSPVVFIVIPGFTVIAVARSVTAIQRLRAEREELARAAAANEERLRIARDLHDLLGHTLSLIALKSELAGRLVAAAPERAAAEIGDVEAAARQALHEVREAVAGYRRPSLAGELEAARQLLAAAGIVLTLEGEALELPPDAEAALSWVVREGVTNVLRHSRARRCAIGLERCEDRVAVEIRDDGRAEAGRWGRTRETDGQADGRIGSGLRGLEERVRALGGEIESGPGPGAGFRLAVSLPVRPDATLKETLAHRADAERAEAS